MFTNGISRWHQRFSHAVSTTQWCVQYREATRVQGVHGDRELPKLPHTAARMDASQARNEKQSGSGDTTTEAMASAAEHGTTLVRSNSFP